MHCTGHRSLMAIHRSLPCVALAAVALLLLGCSKNDITGPNGPTSGSLSIGVAGGFINANRSSTILEFQATLDGLDGPTIIQDTSYTPATNVAELDGNAHRISRGFHTLTLKIARQTSSSNTYSTYALVVLVIDPATGGVVLQMTPADKVATLENGTRIDIDFKF